MLSSDTKKIVLFGAGKIGRSFIGQLFSRSGYEVVFIDIDTQIINALNENGSYKVFICDTNPETIIVENVRGVLASEVKAVSFEIVTADILAVSIGKNGLKHIVPTLSHALLKREARYPGRMLDIILAENMRNADEFLRNELLNVLPADYPLDQRVGLIETSIGKMVPLIVNNRDDDILSVSAEAYNTLIVNKEAFKKPIPSILGMEAKENMKAWVDRKLFIHNFGHAATAYLGFKKHPDLKYLWEVLEDEEIRSFVKSAMLQSAEALQHEYPGVFTKQHLNEHIDDLIHRFSNRYLGDTIFRVGCDLYRKLSPDDRIIAPLTSAKKYGLTYNMIEEVLKAALHFNASGPDGQMYPSDINFRQELKEKGEHYILKKVCKSPPQSPPQGGG
jgi:Mannitol-1-phosphate/altronate dehydrogenases